jgi:flavin-dependent dehydrogenase
MISHDVCIIGGSLAGSACLRELERLGIDAVAFERDRFPRDKVCGGFVSPGGVECLDELGVLEAVQNAGAVPVRSTRIRVGLTETEFRFREPGGLGISRSMLDFILADRPQIHQGQGVVEVIPRDGRFILLGESFEVSCRVLIDAAGKLSRFTKRQSAEEFGIQYEEPEDRGSVMDFWFFQDGYGGAVSIEGGKSNFCFLISKDKVADYLGRPHCLVTGPLAYEPLPSDYIAIGDAAGMVDPFCGEGMRHALDTGIVAARNVARGIRDGQTYQEIRRNYECEWQSRWARRRALAASFRSAARWERKGLTINKRLLDLMFHTWQRYSE